MDIVDFLLARISEDESKAVELLQRRSISLSDKWYEERMLTECQAKRAVVDIISYARGSVLSAMIDGEGPESQRIAESIAWTTLTLSALALPYEAHPDYQASWRLTPGL